MKRPRPQVLPSITYEMANHCGEIYLTVTLDKKGRPFEVFARFGRNGSCGAAIFDGLTQLVSYALRSGMDPEDAVKALSGIRCSQGKHTCLDALAQVLKDPRAASPPSPGQTAPLPLRVRSRTPPPGGRDCAPATPALRSGAAGADPETRPVEPAFI